MSKFYNPYHFVPLHKRTDADVSRDLLAEDALNGKWGVHGHDRYGKELFSGRLVCSLETETPIFIGAGQKDVGGQKVVDHFSMDGRPAIPGTSLRGMLSSLAEAASNSALRVLHRDKLLSYRKRMGEYLSALGMVVSNEDGSFNLQPLALPTLVQSRNGYVVPENYLKIFESRVQLKVYVGNYDRSGNADHTLRGKRSYSPAASEFWYAKLNTERRLQGNLLFPDKQLRHPTLRRRDLPPQPNLTYVIGQTCEGQIISERDWLNKPEIERHAYTRGFFRILGREGRNDMPSTKRHELFIPYTKDMESNRSVPIPARVIKRFHDLCDQRTDDNVDHPYTPIGTRSQGKNKYLRLQHGDIVYFAPNTDGTEVNEISFSSIWRGYAGTVEDFFEKVDPDLLPFTKTRTSITPAELLFGFVQDEKGQNSKSLAYKGKVRISCATLNGSPENLFDQEVTLKVLSSPKPPSPALYFKPAVGCDGEHVSKAALKPGVHEPQGRKVYLHHPVVESQKAPWQTAHENELLSQKNRISPLRSKLRFTFHIDFDNLDEWELGLLCYAVRPTEKYRHKIGMGKSIGLGTVRLDLEKLQLVNRKHRYSAKGFLEERHCTSSRSVGEFRALFSSTMSPDIANAICLLGDPLNSSNFPIHTPQITGNDLESDTYKWFVENDRLKSGQQYLRPLRAGLEELPHLDTPQQPQDTGQGGGYRAGGGPRHDNRQNHGDNRHHQGGNRDGGGNGRPRR